MLVNIAENFGDRVLVGRLWQRTQCAFERRSKRDEATQNSISDDL